MEFSRPGDLIAPRFPIIFQLETFSTSSKRPLGLWSINQVLKWHKMPPNRCFCSEHIVLAGRQHFITLWHYTHPNTFSNRYPLFRGGGTTLLALFAIIIDVDFDVELENLRHRFCHHRLSLWMQLMKPQWNGPLLRSCIWSVLLWRCFFFTFWSGIALMSLLWRPGATKILPPIPAIEGSVKQDLSLFAQISFLYPKYIFLSWSQSFFSSRHTTSFPWYIFSLCCTWSMLRCYVFSTV